MIYGIGACLEWVILGFGTAKRSKNLLIRCDIIARHPI
jgi:hypothetical protein